MLSVQDDIVFLAKICARYPASFMQDLATLSKKVAKSLEVLQEGVRSCKIAYQEYLQELAWYLQGIAVWVKEHPVTMKKFASLYQCMPRSSDDEAVYHLHTLIKAH